jgi:DMSO/TMAO reductase YedYZ molybdopterin-dependent catalytic subunit
MKSSVFVILLCVVVLAGVGLSCSRAGTITTATSSQTSTVQAETRLDPMAVAVAQPAKDDEQPIIQATVQAEVSPIVPPAITSAQPATNSEAATIQATTEKDISAFRLTVDGLVNLSLSLTYESILQYPAITQKVWLVCPGVFQTDREWTGVPVATLLQEAGVKTEANKVVFTSSDGYHSELPIGEAQQEGVFVAYQVDGGTLSADDGYPIRLVTQREGSYWVRQLVHIEVE